MTLKLGTTKAKQGMPTFRLLALVVLAVLVAAVNQAAILVALHSRQQPLQPLHRNRGSSTTGSLHISGLLARVGNRGVNFPRVFVGVLSAAPNSKARQVIRQTWATDPLLGRVMFFCLRPPSPEAFWQLRKEAAVARDISITSEAIDHYYNTTYAVLDMFKVVASWSDSFDYVIKTDDDIYVRPQLILQELHGWPRQWLYAGSPMQAHSVIRNSTWHAVPYSNWPFDTPVRYAYGAGYILSMDLAVQIAAGAPHMIMEPNNLLYIEDIAVGYWVDYIANENKVNITYNANITRGDDCSHKTMFYHVTSQPKWAEVLCMHRHGGRCCEDRQCADCLHSQRMGDLLGGPTTHTQMRAQPPFAEGCFIEVNQMQQVGCPILDCSLHSSCRVGNTSCCAYFHFQMLDFLDRLLTAYCLQGQYMLVYGTALGSARSQSILSYAEDVDVALTPLAVQFLERNTTKQLLWRHGYTFWHHNTSKTWKLCAHAGHPSPHFRAAMVSGANVDQYESTTGRPLSAYLNAWLMWPVTRKTRRCSAPFRGNFSMTSLLQTPWDTYRSSWSTDIDVCRLIRQADKQHKALKSGSATGRNSTKTIQRYCVSKADMPYHLVEGSRTGRIGNKLFPLPNNHADIMAAAYRKRWQGLFSSHQDAYGIARQEKKVMNGLLEKLSVTAWGDVPWQQRKRACQLN